jgi:2-desacetyl-2-hydroxyethyl bacteriochlorophyllide A dehydrogenase
MSFGEAAPMETTPAVVFRGAGDVALEEVPMPAVGPGELLIRTRKSLISTGTELTILGGDSPPGSVWAALSHFPTQVGYSNLGEVVGVGEGVAEEWRGRRVCTYSGHRGHAVAAAASARPVPDGVTDEQATFFALSEIAMNGLRRAQLQWGESVVVFGAGLLGQLAARYCRICGARPVIAVDVADRRLRLLPEGDPAVVRANPGEREIMEVVAEATRGRMADVAFEVTGHGELIPGQLPCLRRQGRLVILSAPRGRTDFDFHDLCCWPSYTIIGAHNSSTPPCETSGNPWTWQRHTELFFDLLLDGELDLDPLISHSEPYTHAPALYQMLLADRSQAMGVILDWTAAP